MKLRLLEAHASD